MDGGEHLSPLIMKLISNWIFN